MRTYALVPNGRAGVASPPESARSAPPRAVPPLPAPPNRPTALAGAPLALLQRLGQVAGLRPVNPAALSEAEAKAMRANNRRLRRTLILTAIMSIAVVRACREEIRFPNSPPAGQASKQ